MKRPTSKESSHAPKARNSSRPSQGSSTSRQNRSEIPTQSVQASATNKRSSIPAPKAEIALQKSERKNVSNTKKEANKERQGLASSISRKKKPNMTSSNLRKETPSSKNKASSSKKKYPQEKNIYKSKQSHQLFHQKNVIQDKKPHIYQKFQKNDSKARENARIKKQDSPAPKAENALPKGERKKMSKTKKEANKERQGLASSISRKKNSDMTSSNLRKETPSVKNEASSPKKKCPQQKNIYKPKQSRRLIHQKNVIQDQKPHIHQRFKKNDSKARQNTHIKQQNSLQEPKNANISSGKLQAYNQPENIMLSFIEKVDSDQLIKSTSSVMVGESSYQFLSILHDKMKEDRQKHQRPREQEEDQEKNINRNQQASKIIQKHKQFNYAMPQGYSNQSSKP